MSRYEDELLDVSVRLIARDAGQRGRLPSALTRRSISTTYYALFHFLLEEVGKKVVGAGGNLRVRRRMLARVITHRGAKVALGKIRGIAIDPSVATFFEAGGIALGAAPRFARNLAAAFWDAHAKRESADYDLNEPLSEADARVLRGRVRRAIRGWRAAGTKADRDFKHALSMLILLRGQLRQDN